MKRYALVASAVLVGLIGLSGRAEAQLVETAIRIVNASGTLQGPVPFVDGVAVGGPLSFGATSTQPVSAGTHVVALGELSENIEVTEGCTVNVVVTERGRTTTPSLVSVPTCQVGRIRLGASRISLLIASDEPGPVRFSAGEAGAVDVLPYQVSEPLEPTGGSVTLTLTSVESGVVYATADADVPVGTSAVVLYAGWGDLQPFQLFVLNAGSQPADPPIPPFAAQIGLGLDQPEFSVPSPVLLLAGLLVIGVGAGTAAVRRSRASR